MTAPATGGAAVTGAARAGGPGRRSPGGAWRRAGRMMAAAAAAGGACVAYGAGVEREWYVLRHATVPALRPGGRGPLRVLHVSDLHLWPGRRRIRRFLDRARDCGPDLVVATGDLLGGDDTVDEAIALLTRLRGDRPALAVLGSNDRYGPTSLDLRKYFRPRPPGVRRHGPPLDTDRLVRGLEDGGWQMVDNRRAEVATAAGSLDVAGLADPHIDRDDPAGVDWGASGPADPALRLGVVHAPYLRALDVFDGHGYDLVLAGHTHGGQVRLPGVGALSSNCDLPLREARGLSRHEGRIWLHVSAGLGTARTAPFRFNCRPEATVLDVVAADSRPAGVAR